MSSSEPGDNRIGRRKFLKVAGVMGGGMVMSGMIHQRADAKPAQTSLLGRDALLAGAIEMHVHSYPDVRRRKSNDLQQEMGMRAILIKNHEFITNDRAYLVRQAVPGLEVFGGIALNEAVGGINPAAVEAMLNFNDGYGRCVWLPTYQSAYECSHKAHQGDAGGVRVVDSLGHVLTEVRKVMRIVAKADIILATGHISPAESVAVVRAAKEEGVTKIVVTHAMQSPFEMSLDDMKRCTEMGAVIEHSFLGYLMGPQSAIKAYRTGYKHISIEAFVQAIGALGDDNCIISTDVGQEANPEPVEALKTFILKLMESGIKKEQIDRMVRANPARLLGLA